MQKSEGEDVMVQDKVTGETYKINTVRDFRVFRDFCLDEGPDWKHHYTKGPCAVYSRVDATTKLTVFKVVREMATVPPRVLYDSFHDADYRRTWDKNMVEGYNLTILNPHNDIGYYSMKLIWPLKDRDFCNMRSWMEFTNGDYVIFNHSVPYPKAPVYSKFIRAVSHLTGYFVQTVGTGCRLTFITHSDIKGSIPKAIIDTGLNQFIPKQMTSIEECALKYVAWAEREYPPGHVHPWTTPKMDWNSQYNYPGDEAVDEPAADDEANAAAGASAAASIGAADRNFTSAERQALERELVDLRRRLLDATHTGGGAPLSLAPVAPAYEDDPPPVARYRAVMQQLTNSIDRQFLEEGRAPTLREYLVRLQYSLEGILRTAPPA